MLYFGLGGLVLMVDQVYLQMGWKNYNAGVIVIPSFCGDNLCLQLPGTASQKQPVPENLIISFFLFCLNLSKVIFIA